MCWDTDSTVCWDTDSTVCWDTDSTVCWDTDSTVCWDTDSTVCWDTDSTVCWDTDSTVCWDNDSTVCWDTDTLAATSIQVVTTSRCILYSRSLFRDSHELVKRKLDFMKDFILFFFFCLLVLVVFHQGVAFKLSPIYLSLIGTNTPNQSSTIHTYIYRWQLQVLNEHNYINTNWFNLISLSTAILPNSWYSESR